MVFGSLLSASKTVGEELQKAGKRRAQQLLPSGTEQWVSRMNQELEVFLTGGGGGGGGQAGEEEMEAEGTADAAGAGIKARLADRLAASLLPADTEKLARGIQQVIGQIRQSSNGGNIEFS